jgi:hypothetical protein
MSRFSSLSSPLREIALGTRADQDYKFKWQHCCVSVKESAVTEVRSDGENGVQSFFKPWARQPIMLVVY